MPAVQTATFPTIESLSAMLEKTNRTLDEIAESRKEADRQQRERWAEADKRFEKEKEELNQKLGSYINLFGDMTEAMIAPKICKKFEEFGLYFPKANPNVRVNDHLNKISYEIDLMLENGDKAMLIEVKTRLTIERIDKHMIRMEKNRQYADLHGDKRTFLGAVAGIVVTDEVRDYALEQGFYFIEYAGENFYITPPAVQVRE